MEAREFNRLLKNINKSTKAFDELFNFYFKRIVFHLQYKYGRVIAEDAAQTFFESLIDKADSIDYVYFPTSWIYTCCENCAKRQLERDTRAVVPDKTDIQIFSKEELYGDLYDEIEQLSQFDQDIIYKHYWEGYSFEEIASMYGCKSGMIRQRYFRIRKKFKN